MALDIDLAPLWIHPDDADYHGADGVAAILEEWHGTFGAINHALAQRHIPPHHEPRTPPDDLGDWPVGERLGSYSSGGQALYSLRSLAAWIWLAGRPPHQAIPNEELWDAHGDYETARARPPRGPHGRSMPSRRGFDHLMVVSLETILIPVDIERPMHVEVPHDTYEVVVASSTRLYQELIILGNVLDLIDDHDRERDWDHLYGGGSTRYPEIRGVADSELVWTSFGNAASAWFRLYTCTQTALEHGVTMFLT